MNNPQETTGGDLTLVYLNGREENVVNIPPAVKINSAFFDLRAIMLCISIPSTVKVIEAETFANCYQLECVRLSEGLLDIGN